MQQINFNVQAVFNRAWEIFKTNKVFFIVFPLAVGAIFITLLWLAIALQTIAYIGNALFGLLFILCALFGVYALNVYVKATLKIISGQVLSAREILKTGLNEYLNFLGAAAIIIAATVLALAITGSLPVKILGGNFIVLAFTFALSAAAVSFTSVIFLPVLFMTVENKDDKILDIFKKSYALAIKRLPSCLIFVWLCFALIIAGIIPLGLGLIISAPLALISAAVFYEKLNDDKRIGGQEDKQQN
ncbi:hypothetical protein [Endomicrobium proavitum]|uniref:Uncharacterized protein n=1 Tax=Endomicrobium proavitum TaxID=1408281 RepID=A0A0G3WK10_9BACT|nr:hypothetical protein [Endomicrobium proavitum]AKL98643.1 membrane protein of unknown function [Endomicrobium proavitum]